MTLTAKDVAEITRLLEQSSFDELYLEVEGLKISLRRAGATNGPLPATPVAPGVTPTAPSRAASNIASAPQAFATRPPAADPTLQDIRAPLLGTFYRAPKPGAAPFVEVGSQVEEDTIIGILEVMKLMNTVRAGVCGRVAEIVTQDGALVEYGETLLRVRKSG